MDLNFLAVDAKKILYRHLKGVSDPEQKRKVIGRTFIDIFDNESAKLKDDIKVGNEYKTTNAYFSLAKESNMMEGQTADNLLDLEMQLKNT